MSRVVDKCPCTVSKRKNKLNGRGEREMNDGCVGREHELRERGLTKNH